MVSADVLGRLRRHSWEPHVGSAVKRVPNPKTGRTWEAYAAEHDIILRSSYGHTMKLSQSLMTEMAV